MRKPYILEKTPQNKFRDALEELNRKASDRGGNCKAIKLHGSVHLSGEPDVIGIVNGRMFAFEFKSPSATGKAAQPRPDQSKALRDWKHGGAIAACVNDEDEALRLLGLLDLYNEIHPNRRKRKEVDLSGLPSKF